MQEYIRVEYDQNYFGGNYSGQGKYCYIPCDDGDRSIEEAFERLTNLDARNIIHYCPDEIYVLKDKRYVLRDLVIKGMKYKATEMLAKHFASELDSDFPTQMSTMLDGPQALRSALGNFTLVSCGYENGSMKVVINREHDNQQFELFLTPTGYNKIKQ